MNVKVCSAYSNEELEKKVQKIIEIGEDEDFYVKDIKYSTCFDISRGEILRSALLMFEEIDFEEYEDD